MKYLILFYLIFIYSGLSAEKITLNSEKWKLTWSDEFNGPKVDKSKWTHVTKDTIGGGYGNNELQFYTDRPINSYTKDGKLVIQALKEKYQRNAFTSAKLESVNKGDFTYGKFSFRAKMPKGKGVWPAIWMMPSDMKKYGGWPACGEIDIMELVGHEANKVHGTLHYGNPHKHTGKHYELPKGDFSEDFHVFELIWQPGKIRWFIDGKLYQTQTDWFTTGSKSYPAPYDRDFYLILNLAVGGRWPGSPNAQTKFPALLEIDYARVYKYSGEYPPAAKPKSAIKGKAVKLPYPVYSEDLGPSEFHPTGYMGNHGAMKVDTNSTIKPHSGRTCMKVHYSRSDNWSGVLYQNPANDWGDKVGGLDLSQATKLTFWARGEDGGEKVKFGMGLIGRDKKFHDTYKVEKEIILTKEWKQYSLKLESEQLGHIKTGFSFAFGATGKPLTFFLDDIVYK